MAHKKGVGSSKNGRDSNSKRLGVKVFGGQKVKAGAIVIRQRGSRYGVLSNAYFGKDYTIHAKVDGVVNFIKRSSGMNQDRYYVSVIPHVPTA